MSDTVSGVRMNPSPSRQGTPSGEMIGISINSGRGSSPEKGTPSGSMPSLPLFQAQPGSVLRTGFSERLCSNRVSKTIAPAESSTQAATISAELSLI